MTEDTARKLMGGAALVAALGTFLPWAQAGILNITGVEADRGQVALVACAIGCGLAFWRDRSLYWQALTSLTAGGMAFWFAWDVAHKPGGIVSFDPGFGVYLTVAASAVWLLVLIVRVNHATAEVRA